MALSKKTTMHLQEAVAAEGDGSKWERVGLGCESWTEAGVVAVAVTVAEPSSFRWQIGLAEGPKLVWWKMMPS